VIAPAVLIVADQVSRRVRGEGRLAGAGEAEEDRRVARVADVRGAVHRKHALLRHQVVQHREDALLHFPAYRVPPISTAFRAKFNTMNVEVRVPCFAGSAWNSGA
jgi:hypothetical protein